MVVVRIELWSGGSQKEARTIGIVTIANDGEGDAEIGNYDVSLSHAGRFFGRPGAWKTGRVSGFRRSLSPYHLLLRALRACSIG